MNASNPPTSGGDVKASRRIFLAQNPFPCPLTLGFFYREKMRAIHRVAPADGVRRVLEVGGGQSGLGAMLYPDAEIVNTDLDASYGQSPMNRRPNVRFLAADATRLPFADGSFDVVTMFDLLEHVPDDAAAAQEAKRVLRPTGRLLVSTPRENWRFPYHRIFKPVAPSEQSLFDAWGHVRRGYSLDELDRLIPMTRTAQASFISGLTAFNHDVSFSRLSHRKRRLLCALLSPLTWLGYLLHRAEADGTETASRWEKTDRR